MTIKEFRLQQGLSQPKLAKALGIGVSTVGGYENGRINPSEKVIAKIREIFGVDLAAETPAAEAPAEAAPAKPRRRAAKGKPAETPAPAIEKVEPAKPAPRAKPAPSVIIQSPMGGEITPEEIISRIGGADKIYIRVDQNKAYFIKGEESGSIDLW